MLFKILIPGRLYSLSHEDAEQNLPVSLACTRFAGLSFGDRVPDAAAICLFAGKLTAAGLIGPLSGHFGSLPAAAGLTAREGSMVDATFVEAPRQRNVPRVKPWPQGRPDERGPGCPGWRVQAQTGAEGPGRAPGAQGRGHLLRLRNTVKADARSGLITAWHVTDAAVRDIRSLDAALRDNDGTALCDAGYAGFADHVTRQGVRVKARGRRVRGQGELTEQQLSENRRSPESARALSISSIFMERSMRGLTVWTIGMAGLCLTSV